MRAVIYQYLMTQNLAYARLSDSLPWNDNGEPLYYHNKKFVYIDTPNTRQEPLFDAFDNTGTVNETTTVSVYFVNDAKILPPEYDQVVQTIMTARTAPGTEGYIQKLCQVSNSYIGDALVTTMEFSFRRLLTN